MVEYFKFQIQFKLHASLNKAQGNLTSFDLHSLNNQPAFATSVIFFSYLLNKQIF